MKRWYLTVIGVCPLSFVAAGQIRPEEPRVASAGQLLISEFRLHGLTSVQDEFIEIFNASGSSHTVSAASLSNGNFTTSLGKSWGGAGYTPLPQFQ